MGPFAWYSRGLGTKSSAAQGKQASGERCFSFVSVGKGIVRKVKE